MPDDEQRDEDAGEKEMHEQLSKLFQDDDRFQFLRNGGPLVPREEGEDSKGNAKQHFLDRVQSHINKGEGIPVDEFTQEELNQIYAEYVKKIPYMIDYQIITSKSFDKQLNAHLDLGKTQSKSLLYLFSELEKINTAINVPKEEKSNTPLWVASIVGVILSVVAVVIALV